MTTETTELALFPKLNLPSVAGITEEMNKSFGTMYTRIEAGIAELPTDMSIKANREKVASYAYSISRTKTGLDEAAAGVSSDAKQIVDAVNTERRQLKNTLDILRDKARERLDAWEAIQESFLIVANQAVHDLSKPLDGWEESRTLVAMLDNLQSWQITADIYGDHVERVTAAHLSAVERLDAAIVVAANREAEQAELEQLRREKAEREAAEAEKANKRNLASNLIQHIKNAGNGMIDGISYPLPILIHEVQDRVLRDMEACGEHAAEVEKVRAETLQLLKEALDRQTEEATRAAEERAKREAAEAIEQAKREKAEAEKRAREAEEDRKRREIEAEEQRKEAAARAEEDAKRREAAAKEQERLRIADQARAKEKADQERAADLAHRKRLNSEAVAGLVKACGMTEAEAQAVVIAIYKEQVPHVAITY